LEFTRFKLFAIDQKSEIGNFFPIKSYKLIGSKTKFKLNPLSDLKHFFKEIKHEITINIFHKTYI